MESILERAARVLAQHPAPALPLDELRRLVRGSGVEVPEEVLLRALRRGHDRFRLLDPWRGPWGTLRAVNTRGGPGRGGWSAVGRPGPPERRAAPRPGGPAGRRWSRSGRGVRRAQGAGDPGPWTRGPGTGGAAGSPVPGLGRRWVVARPAAAGGDGCSGLRRLRQSLAHLGWALDGDSPLEMARWCRLLHEEGRVRARARAVAGTPAGAAPWRSGPAVPLRPGSSRSRPRRTPGHTGGVVAGAARTDGRKDAR